MDGVRSTRRIADTVRVLMPDIVCFQEIHRRMVWSGREDQPAALETLLGREFVFQRNVRFGRGAYGIGIATRGTIVERREHMLPGNREQRGALELCLRDIAGLRQLTVFCTHWGLDDEERRLQAEAMAAIIGPAPRPLVFCGDLNEAADGRAVKLLIERTGLLDADAALNRPTFTSDAPTVRIDYCLYSPDLHVTRVDVGSSLASDHLPLSVDLELAQIGK
jgi:endonuclease/exonuclease/phosphatase family metal-dependent hydrolase